MLTEYGINPATLKPGEHKLSLKLGDEKSNELTFTIQRSEPKRGLGKRAENDLGWSETVEDLKARLSVETKGVVQRAAKLSVHLELRNASETRDAKELHLDQKNLKFAVVDRE